MLLEQTESELIVACQSGDRDSFRLLFERYKDKVYTIALRYSGNAATAEDIAQDTFVKLFAAIATFRGASGFESWLYRMVVNACFDHRRRTRRWFPLLDMFTREPDAERNAIRDQEANRVTAALSDLPADQRMAVVLRYSQELPYEQIAQAMGCSAGTVASRLNRAHKSLEKRLRKLHV